MDRSRFIKVSDVGWKVEQSGQMRGPAILFADLL